MHVQPRKIYFSRHGQSEYNVLHKIGGNSNLSPEGEAYASKLGKWVHTELEPQSPKASLSPRSCPTHTNRSVLGPSVD